MATASSNLLFPSCSLTVCRATALYSVYGTLYVQYCVQYLLVLSGKGCGHCLTQFVAVFLFPYCEQGYCDLDYLKSGIPSKRIDVYSFGIVLMELVTGEGPHRIVKPYRYFVRHKLALNTPLLFPLSLFTVLYSMLITVQYSTE